MMRLYRLLSDKRHQHLWQKPNGEPKTHHKRECEHCRERGHKVGCVLPFRHTEIVYRDKPVLGFWKVRNIWKVSSNDQGKPRAEAGEARCSESA